MDYPQTTFTRTTLTNDSLLGRTRHIAWASTIPLQLEILKSTGRYDAFKLKYKPIYDDAPEHWPVPKHLFWDSDVAKWLEGACYFLHTYKDAEIEGAVQELVEMIREAQQPDSYLNIHFTVVAPNARWSNLRDMHELYNAGHLIEAALAHEQLYHNGRLLEPLVKYVELMCDVFGPGEKQLHGYPGHPEIELALLRLYSVTQNPRHLQLARYFIEERGNPEGCEGRHYYDVEAEKRGERPYERPNHYPQRLSHWYNQSHRPIVEQDEVVGHAVRAMYLFTAVTDLMIIEKRSGSSGVDYRKAMTNLWDNMVQKKMSVTGGIGAMKQWEGFGINYFLPQSTDEGGCYNETCASIGVVLLANRLLKLELNHEYADIMELALYNTVLTGMSRDGKSFTYENQLGSSDRDLSKREDWFQVSCCPPNVSRLLGSIGGYIWSSKVTQDESGLSSLVEIDVHLFVSATLEVPTQEGSIKLVQATNYPWTGDMSFELTGSSNNPVTLRIRVPTWSKTWSISPQTDLVIQAGYVTIPDAFLKDHPKFTFSIPLTIRTISQPRSSPMDFALARGPLVYCAEDIDNPWVQDHFNSVYVDLKLAEFTEVACDDANLREYYIALKASGGIFIANLEQASMPGLEEVTYRALENVSKGSGKSEMRFVPYYLRANRGGRGQMRVGLKRHCCG